MTKLDDHPSVVRFRQSEPRPRPGRIDAERLRQICLDSGADDAGLVEIGRPALDDQRADILGLYPLDEGAPQLRLPDEPGADPQPGPLGRQPGVPPHRRSRQRGRPQGRRRPGEPRASGRSTRRWASRWRWTASPDKIWVVSHKPVAVAAGLGHMGIHRNVIHPKFGNFILLGTVLIGAEATELRPADRLQPVPGVQAVRGGVPGRGHRPGRPLRLLGLLHAQLPGVHGRLHRLGRAGRRQQGRPRLPQDGSRTRRPPRCGRASPSGRTTRRRTAWRSARRARTSSARSWPTARAS